MIARIFSLAALLVGSTSLVWASDDLPWTIDFEGSQTWMPKNNVAIPGNTGTPFSFKQLTGGGAFPSGRIIVTYERQSGPGWRLFLAPLRISGTGQLQQATQFEGINFAAGTDTLGVYRFNSWRLTYRNRWAVGAKTDLRIGFTLKVRDAEVTLRQGAVTRTKTDVGVVPLLHLAASHQFSPTWGLEFDFDGAAASQGRAVDGALRLVHNVSPRLALTLGWRTLEGGASNDEVFNFTQLNSVSFGLRGRF